MRTVLHITLIFSLLSGLASCYSEKMLVDDDVYIVQSNKLPVGESLNDQTSYSAFKRQNQSGTAKSAYYQNSQNYLYTSNCWGFNSMFNPCGCSYLAMSMYDPMFYGMHAGFGNSFYAPYYGMMSPYYNPYFGFGSPFGFGNPYYGSPFGFGNQFGYGFGNPYGYGNYYSNGSWMNQPVGPQVGGAHYSGPRGSLSGYVPNSQRNNPNVLKSNQQLAGGNTGGSTFNRPTQQMASSPNRPAVERPSYTPSVTRGVQQQTTSGGSPIRNTGGVTPVDRGGSGQPVNQQQRVTPQQNQPQQIQRGGGGGGSTPTPSRGTGGGGTGVRRN
jgi:hypothetical protein